MINENKNKSFARLCEDDEGERRSTISTVSVQEE